MEIIFGKENAEKLKDKYLLLELESVLISGVDTQLYCVIPTDKIPVDKLTNLPHLINLHGEFLNGYKKKEYSYCLQCIEHLRGQFAGEVDSFYDEITKRIGETK